MDRDIIILFVAFYLFTVATLTKIGSKKEIGGRKAFLISMFLTPVVGLFFVAGSPRKNLLRIVHYKCPRCGLEYTDYHRSCPSCRKEGVQVRLERKRMKTY
ncbi:MAG: hypothetical protein JW861_06110 [Bacteroidales bacterium]|nr:hypothetical protein [Bacteroidales bacterium]